MTENSAGEQPRPQLNIMSKKKAIKMIKVVNIFMTQSPKNLYIPTTRVIKLYKDFPQKQLALVERKVGNNGI